MEWQDTGIVLSAAKHGETSAIVELLTHQHGRHKGLVRGGIATRRRGTLHGAVMVQGRQAREPIFAQERKVDRKGQRDQSRVRADVTRGLLAADMLLAGRQGEDEAAAPVFVDRLAAQATRHLAHKALARRHQAEVGRVNCRR